MRGAARSGRILTPSFLLVTFSAFAYFTSYGFLAPTLPTFVADELRAGDVAVGVVAGSFAFSALLARPWVGRLGDRRGRGVLVVGGTILGAVSVFGLLGARSLPALIALRLVSGVAEALFFVGAVTVVNDLAPDTRRGEAVSLFSVSLYAGLAVGPMIGESLQRALGYGAVWLGSGAFMLAALALAALVGDTRPAGMEASAGPRRFLHPAGFFPGVVMFTSVFGFAGYMTFLPLYVDDVGLDGARMVLLLYGSLLVLIRLFGARIPDLIGVGRAGLVGLTATASGLALVGLWRSVVGLLLGTTVFAVGQALAFPAFMALSASRAAPAERAAAIGTTTAFIDLGFGVGPIVLGVVAANYGDQRTFLAGSIVAVAGVALQLTARSRRRAGGDTASA